VDFLRALEPGDRIGGYTIVRKLGEGGMGIVYEASSAQPERSVALKVLSPWLVSELGRQRFEREVRACAQLTHPSTVLICDYGESEGGILFYAMELLDGLDLHRLVTLDGAQPPARTIRLLDQIAGALGEAHEKGLVHRDIKPQNIILCELGGIPDVAKLVDFGLVMSIASSPRRLTLDGPVIGTPRYVAPEMLRAGGEVTAASDFYQLGLVAFFLLTARHAFDGSGSAEILKKQRDEPAPSLVDAAFGVPADLASIVAWCLEKDPGARPKDANTLRSALARCGDATRWDEAEARAWWSGWRSREDGDLPRPSTPPSERSVDRSRS
jgi:serine/threonine-protein kinase